MGAKVMFMLVRENPLARHIRQFLVTSDDSGGSGHDYMEGGSSYAPYNSSTSKILDDSVTTSITNNTLEMTLNILKPSSYTATPRDYKWVAFCELIKKFD